MVRDMGRNVYTAIEWFKKAADNGFADAMYNLGVVYHKSREVKDIKLAVYWYQKGARKKKASRVTEEFGTVAWALSVIHVIKSLINEKETKEHFVAFPCVTPF
jgi:TPR repeat protein